MKVCEVCGEEMCGRDGENICSGCLDDESYPTPVARKKRDRARARLCEREDVLRSLGMTKVKGSLGGTYWE